MDHTQIIKLTQLVDSPSNPRKSFDQKAIDDLATSIKAVGIIHPLVVRPNGKKFEIVVGASRKRAAEQAGLAEVPCTVRELTDQEVLEIQISENLQRRDVHPYEEAAGFAALLAMPGYDKASAAAKFGHEESFIVRRLALLKLIDKARDEFLDGRILVGHAEQLCRLQPKDQREALEACFESDWHKPKEKLLVGVRELTRWIQNNLMLDLHKAPFKKDDEQLVPAAGSCLACPKRTGSNMQLFGDVDKADTCTDRACFHSKIEAHMKRKERELAEAGEVTRISQAYSFHTKEEMKLEKAGVLPSRVYNDAGKKKCETTVQALVVDGREKGHVKSVCTNPRCKVHGYSTAPVRAADMSPAERKEKEKAAFEAKVNKEARLRVIKTVADACAGAVARNSKLSFLDVFRFLARVHVSEYKMKPTAEAAGLGKLEKFDQVEDNLESWIRLLVADVFDNYRLGYGYADACKALMKTVGADEKAIEKIVRAELKEVKAASAGRKTAPTASAPKAKGKGAKAKPAKGGRKKKAADDVETADEQA